MASLLGGGVAARGEMFGRRDEVVEAVLFLARGCRPGATPRRTRRRRAGSPRRRRLPSRARAESRAGSRASCSMSIRRSRQESGTPAVGRQTLLRGQEHRNARAVLRREEDLPRLVAERRRREPAGRGRPRSRPGSGRTDRPSPARGTIGRSTRARAPNGGHSAPIRRSRCREGGSHPRLSPASVKRRRRLRTSARECTARRSPATAAPSITSADSGTTVRGRASRPGPDRGR